MIFVALGTQKFQFNRLLKMIDHLFYEVGFSETVFAQVGFSDYKPKNYEYVPFLSKDEFEKKIKECSVLVTHSGVATIISGLRNQKKVIVVPRLSRYGEHVDDHQVQIARAFCDQKYVLMYHEGDNINTLINRVKKENFERYVSQRENIIKIIDKYIQDS